MIPNLLNWTTYPLTSVIEMLWKQNVRDLEPGSDRVNMYEIELMAMLERTLNYAHTGSARVISRKVMVPHFLGLSVLHDGLPCLNPRLVSFPDMAQNSKVNVFAALWARTPQKKGRRPLMASKRVQELTYGRAHMQVSFHRASERADGLIPDLADPALSFHHGSNPRRGSSSWTRSSIQRSAGCLAAVGGTRSMVGIRR